MGLPETPERGTAGQRGANGGLALSLSCRRPSVGRSAAGAGAFVRSRRGRSSRSRSRNGRPVAAGPGTILLIAAQLFAVVWATDQRSAATLRTVAPAGLTAVTATALWTALAIVVPVIATGNTAAMVAILTAGIVVAESHRGTAHRLPLALLAAAGSALLIFLVISLLLPTIPGFVSDNHPPIYTPATRLVDPVGELALFVVLAAGLAVKVLRTRVHARQAALRHQRSGHLAGPNEMVVERHVEPAHRCTSRPFRCGG